MHRIAIQVGSEHWNKFFTVTDELTVPQEYHLVFSIEVFSSSFNEVLVPIEYACHRA